MGEKFHGVLLLSDMDGTLLNDEKTVPAKNIEAVKYFVENGGAFSIASGRAPASIIRYFSVLPVNVPIITLNGAIIYDGNKGETVWDMGMDKEVASTVMEDVIAHFPHVGVEVYSAHGVHILVQNDNTRAHMQRESLVHFFEKPREIDAPNWYKVLFAAPHEKLCKVEQYIRENGYEERFSSVRYVYSEAYFYEALGADISKGNALDRLCDMCGFNREKTYAVGDNYNDMEMMTRAGFSFAPKSAVPPILAAASKVVCSNNDGAVSEAIAYLDEIY